MDGPKSMAVLKEIERHFGKDIVKLDAEVNSFYIVSSIILLLRMWTRLRSSLKIRRILLLKILKSFSKLD